MRILVVSQFYYPEPLRVNEICEGLVKNGHSVTVVTTFPNYPEGIIYEGYDDEGKMEENINGVRVIRYRSIPRGKGILNLAKSYISFALNVSWKITEIKNEPFDIIYVWEVSPITMVIPAIVFKKLVNIPLFIYCLDIWPESIKDFINNESNPVFKIIKYFSKKIYQQADMIGITSKSFKDYLVEVCNVKEDIIYYLPQHADDIGECPKEVDTGTIDFYFTGNIGESQNIDLIIDAVHLINNIEGFTVNFVGAGSKLEYAKDKVNELGLNKIIIFHGRHPASAMPFFFKKADICILTLNNNAKTGLTIPGKLQTYMAAGKPIVAAIDGDAKQVIEDAKCGYVVGANDVDGFAMILKSIITERHRNTELDYNSRKFYIENYTIDKHINKLDRLFYLLESMRV